MPTPPDYAAASRSRLEEAGDLLAAERYAGAIYVAGRAAESILRAVITIEGSGKAIKGHNIEALAKEANFARRLKPTVQAQVWAAIQ